MNLPKWDKLPKAVALDLDGTLLDSQSRLSERNARAIEGCLALNMPVIIATARPARTVRRLVSAELVSRCSLVIMNGAIASAAPPLSGSFRRALPDEVGRGIVTTALEVAPVRITVELEGYEFGSDQTVDAQTLWERNSATPDMLLTVEQALTKGPAKIALGGNEEELARVSATVLRRYGDLLSVVPSGGLRPLLNITMANATKPESLRRLLSSKGILLADVVAIGDDTPDIDMLMECGISVAVANAIPEVKAVASFETASNDEDGVALVIEQMLSRFK